MTITSEFADRILGIRYDTAAAAERVVALVENLDELTDVNEIMDIVRTPASSEGGR